MTIAEQLKEPVKDEFISTRKGGGGIDLSYVSHRYVKQRLNEVFGWDGWDYTIIETKLFPEECTAFVHVRLSVTTKRVDAHWDKTIERDGLAYGHGRKGAEGFDFAIAEAVTDALKRAAVSLGETMGLSLYPMTSAKTTAPTGAQNRRQVVRRNSR